MGTVRIHQAAAACLLHVFAQLFGERGVRGDSLGERGELEGDEVLDWALCKAAGNAFGETGGRLAANLLRGEDDVGVVMRAASSAMSGASAAAAPSTASASNRTVSALARSRRSRSADACAAALSRSSCTSLRCCCPSSCKRRISAAMSSFALASNCSTMATHVG